MKNTTYVFALVLFTCFIMPTIGYSQEKNSYKYDPYTDIYINYEDQKYASFSEEEVKKFLSKEPNFTELVNEWALYFGLNMKTGGTDVVGIVNLDMLKFLDLDPDKDNTNAIVSFWNTYSKYLICTTKYKDEIERATEHIFKRAVATESYSKMFGDYLMRFKPGVIDFNAIEIVDGKEETLLDYLDKIMDSEDFEKNMASKDIYKKDKAKGIKALRKKLAKRFNAKTAAELKN